jgi:hypothetical protein
MMGPVVVAAEDWGGRARSSRTCVGREQVPLKVESMNARGGGRARGWLQEADIDVQQTAAPATSGGIAAAAGHVVHPVHFGAL